MEDCSPKTEVGRQKYKTEDERPDSEFGNRL